MSEAAGVQVLRQLPPLSLAQGYTGAQTVSIWRPFSYKWFHSEISLTSQASQSPDWEWYPVYMCSPAFRRFSLLASSCYCPVLICHVNNNWKYAVVSWQTVYSSGMLEQFYGIVTVTALLPLRDMSQCAGQLTPQCHCNHSLPIMELIMSFPNHLPLASSAFVSSSSISCLPSFKVWSHPDSFVLCSHQFQAPGLFPIPGWNDSMPCVPPFHSPLSS